MNYFLSILSMVSLSYRGRISILKAALLGLLLSSMSFFSLEGEGRASDLSHEREKLIESGKNPFLVDFSRTSLTLTLLGTVIGKPYPIAIIKNQVTGKISSYKEGDSIDLITDEGVKLVQISKCTVMIERSGRYETFSCNDLILTEYSRDNTPSPLARYRIVTTPGKHGKEFYISKSNYDKEIQTTSKKYGVDPDLVKAVIKVESNFNPNAVSSKNAMGMMQLVSATAKDYEVNDPFDPEENIDGGVRVLRDLMDYFNNNLKLALAAYNAGRGAVVKYGFKIPPYVETISYVEKVLGHYNLLKWDRYGRAK